MKKHIAIFASGKGSNAKAIIEYFKHNDNIEISLVVSNKEDAGVLEIARENKIPTCVLSKEQLNKQEYLMPILEKAQVDLIVLAGFLLLVPSYLVKSFPNRIINIHPALLPKYGGKGMYGMKVHEAVVKDGEKETGITIHEVDALYDEGKILFQAQCSVEPTETPQQIADKVHGLEYTNYPKVIEQWILKT